MTNTIATIHARYPNIAVKLRSEPQRLELAERKVKRADGSRSAYGVYTEADLEYAFASVCDLGNWKDPIHASFKALDSSERNLIEAALIFYCATVPDFRIFKSDKGRVTRVDVYGTGYYIEVGA